MVQSTIRNDQNSPFRKGEECVKCLEDTKKMPQNLAPPVIQSTSSIPNSVSRFKIVPVESRYQRGRWSCYDYYGNDTVNISKQKNEKDKTTEASRVVTLGCSSENNLIGNVSNGLQISGGVTPHFPVTAPTSCVDPVKFAFGDESDSENMPFLKQCSNSFQFPVNSGVSATIPMVPSLDSGTNVKFSTSSYLTTNSDSGEQVKNNGSITPSEMLNYGLGRSLNTASHGDKSILDLLPGGAAQDSTRSINRTRFEKSVATSGAASGPSFVAIDSKIEQAMDLVKTHLMFAVREEVEMLRAKIIELEATVLQLDAENAILREHVSAEVLTKINLQLSQPKPATTAVQ